LNVCNDPLLTDSLCLTFATSHNDQCHNISSKRSDIDYILIPTFIYQDVINLVEYFPVTINPSVFMNVAKCEH